MKNVLMPSVAGAFYPASPDDLADQVGQMLKAANSGHFPRIKALVAPHAGYVYSGSIAASAYKQLADQAAEIKRVLVLAPSHQIYFSGIAASSAEVFRTPLGDVPVDHMAVQVALKLPQVRQLDQAFVGEHALEVQLPFLQSVIPRFELVPFIAGDASPAEVAQLLELLWGGKETLIVVSSDLSHYHDYQTARLLDADTTSAIESLAPDRIDNDGACGRVPLRGLLLAARNHGLSVDTVDLRNSGDTSGIKSRVVGYGAYLFH